MKKNYVFIVLAASVMGCLAFTRMSEEVKIAKYAAEKSHINRSGAPAGKTGAPGENSCTECHSGTVQSGANFNGLTLIDPIDQQPVMEYVPGRTYTVAVTLNSTAARKGFETTARISSNNTTAGTMTAVTGSTQIKTGSAGKKYATHITASTTSQTGWTFTWVAPATDVGEVKFYTASNVTNNNNGSGGDVIRTSQHSFTALDNVGVKEEAKLPFSAYYNADKNAVSLQLESKQGVAYSFNLVDMTGKSVFFKRLSGLEGASKEDVFLPENLKAGMYVIHFFEDNNSFSQKIYITK